MPSCLVSWCKMAKESHKKKSNLQRKIEKHIKLTFHKLPKNEKRRKAWLESLQIDEPATKTGFVCSLHFKTSDINTTLNHTCLRDNAVPIYLPLDENIEDDVRDFEYDIDLDFKDLFAPAALACREKKLSCFDTSTPTLDAKTFRRFKNIMRMYRELQSLDSNKSVTNEMSMTGDIFMNDDMEEKNALLPDDFSEDSVHKFSPFDDYIPTPVTTSRATSVSPLHFEEDKQRISELQTIILKTKAKEAMQLKVFSILRRKLAIREQVIVDLRSIINTMKKRNKIK